MHMLQEGNPSDQTRCQLFNQLCDDEINLNCDANIPDIMTVMDEMLQADFPVAPK